MRVVVRMTLGVCLSIVSLSLLAQTAQVANPIGNSQSIAPQFSAVTSSLVTNGVTYSVAISEYPRGGTSNQYQNFWMKSGLAANDLMPSNNNRLIWNSEWTQKIRSGGYDGVVTSSSLDFPDFTRHPKAS